MMEDSFTGLEVSPETPGDTKLTTHDPSNILYEMMANFIKSNEKRWEEAERRRIEDKKEAERQRIEDKKEAERQRIEDKKEAERQCKEDQKEAERRHKIEEETRHREWGQLLQIWTKTNIQEREVKEEELERNETKTEVEQEIVKLKQYMGRAYEEIGQVKEETKGAIEEIKHIKETVNREVARWDERLNTIEGEFHRIDSEQQKARAEMTEIKKGEDQETIVRAVERIQKNERHRERLTEIIKFTAIEGENPIPHLESLQARFTEGTWTEEEKIAKAKENLTGAALDWWRILRDRPDSFRSYKREIMAQFWSEARQGETMDQIAKEVFGERKDETLVQFLYRQVARIQELDAIHLSEGQVMRILKHNFPPDVRHAMIGHNWERRDIMIGILKDVDQELKERNRRRIHFDAGKKEPPDRR